MSNSASTSSPSGRSRRRIIVLAALAVVVLVGPVVVVPLAIARRSAWVARHLAMRDALVDGVEAVSLDLLFDDRVVPADVEAYRVAIDGSYVLAMNIDHGMSIGLRSPERIIVRRDAGRRPIEFDEAVNEWIAWVPELNDYAIIRGAAFDAFVRGIGAAEADSQDH